MPPFGIEVKRVSIRGEFGRRVSDDELCAEVRQAVEGGDEDALRRLGFVGFGGYVQRLSEIMSDSVTDGLDLSADDFGAIMGEVASPARYAHHLVNEAGTAIQTAKDTPLGIHIKPLEPEFDDDALKDTVGTAASMDDPERAVETLADGLAYAVKKAGNEFVEKNAEQRSRAGFEVSVKRSGSSKCCEWCAARIGSWALKNAPDGVFGCHANCSCTVEYTSSTGAVSQRRGTGRFAAVEYEPPHVMTHEEAREKGGFDEPKRLTGGGNGGILNYRDSNDVYKPVAPEAYSRIKPLNVFGDPRDHQVAAAMRNVLDHVKGKEPGTEWLALYDYWTMGFIDGILSEIGTGDVQSLDHDEAYISIHNHASGDTFSFTDIIKLAIYDNLKTIYVVGNDGSCYSLSKGKDYNRQGFFRLINDRFEHPTEYAADTEFEFIERCVENGLRYTEKK